MFAYIPARGGSKRVPRKNIKPLGGTPIIVRTIGNLLNAKRIRDVYVSTDDPEIRIAAEQAGAQCLAPRAPELADDETGFAELIHRDIPRYADACGGRDVFLVLPTAALVPADVYDAAAEIFLAERPNVLMSAMPYPVSPLWALCKKDDGHWEPILPEYCFTASKDLPTTMADAGLFYGFNVDVMQKHDSLKVVDRLQLFPVSQRYAVDVDEPEDWEALEDKYALLVRGRQ
jgi:pseudaminic acid cytidylyltransferase